MLSQHGQPRSTTGAAHAMLNPRVTLSVVPLLLCITIAHLVVRQMGFSRAGCAGADVWLQAGLVRLLSQHLPLLLQEGDLIPAPQLHDGEQPSHNEWDEETHLG